MKLLLQQKERPVLRDGKLQIEWEFSAIRPPLKLSPTELDASPKYRIIQKDPSEKSQNSPTTRQLSNSLSFHERKLRYEKIREQIFAGKDIVANPTVDTPLQVRGVRQRYKDWTTTKKCISETTFDLPCDTRKFAKVEIGGKQIEGLLDSGASITCLGKDGLTFLKLIGTKIKQIQSSVKTANGSSASII
uniref:SUZ domain-containing protein n=1 Tax=Megaselia scalaris TaxID=36166 RepID=T1GQ90_MEGSC